MSCPKCGSDDIRVIDIAMPRHIGGAIATGIFSSAKVNHHVCMKCGFVESYVPDPEARKAIAEKWPRA